MIIYKLKRSASHHSEGWDLDEVKMSTVNKTMHVGICQSSDTDESAVVENIKKARRTMYSLISVGLHGENGLDPETSIHLYQIYMFYLSFYMEWK